MPGHTILDEIIRWKREEIARARSAVPLAALRARMASLSPPRDLAAALRSSRRPGAGPVRLIAEIKRASPSKGFLRPDLDPVALAGAFEANGAAAISVLTDQRFFRGSLEDLRAVRQSVSLPVLRKDFVLDAYQVYEARAAGADAILLIVTALDDNDLQRFHDLACELGMSVLVEVHDGVELQRALAIGPSVVGVNNRDLRTFEVDLETTARLRPLVPANVILVAESGVHTRADVERLAALGVDAVLVGEALVRARDVGEKVREFIA
jgi:indole-3-glycerol phosphate synthase